MQIGIGIILDKNLKEWQRIVRCSLALFQQIGDEMAKIIKFKKKSKPQYPNDYFLEQLYYVEQMYKQGILNKIIIIGQGPEDKACTSNGINIREAKLICKDFINHPKDYID